LCAALFVAVIQSTCQSRVEFEQDTKSEVHCIQIHSWWVYCLVFAEHAIPSRCFEWHRLLLLLLLLQAFAGSGPRPQEISFQEFKTALLAQGKVLKLEVANNNMVRIYLRNAPADTAGAAPAARAAGGQQQQQQQQRQPVGAVGFPATVVHGAGGDLEHGVGGESVVIGGAGGTAAEGPRGGRGAAKYYFLIGSVDAFERQLEEAQRELGLPSSAWVPVRYSYEV
jgi:hypothetical protein